jgi:DNA-binding XRE family transcriptional regulator
MVWCMNATSRTETTSVEGSLGPGCRLDRAFVADLAEQRGWRNATQTAAGFGINRATYFRMLGGKFQPLLVTARKMANAAGVTVDELFPDGPTGT